MRAIAKTCVERDVDNALLDVRKVHGNVTIGQLHDLAKAFYEMGFRERHHLAILHRYRGGEKAELFAIFAANHGWNVRAFDSFEDAFEWFAQDPLFSGRDKP